MLKNKNTLFWLILFSFLLIPLIVSVISSIHVINFFELSNYKSLAIALSISFEIGALSALAGLVVMDKINKNVIYFIFILLTAYQMMGNTYYAYDMLSEKIKINPNLINNWTELFGFETDDTILMKRIIAIISGAILPIVSLCFLDLSVDYIKKSMVTNETKNEESKKSFLTIDNNPTPEIINEPIDVDSYVSEEPIVKNDLIVEKQLNYTPTEINETITEEDKKKIRDEIKLETSSQENPTNTIKMNSGGNFHNVVYTK